MIRACFRTAVASVPLDRSELRQPVAVGATFSHLLSPAVCAGSMITTIANYYHLSLVMMQFRRLSPRQSNCSLTRALVAIDTYVSDLCLDLGFADCILGTRGNVGASDFGHNAYQALIYLKWRVIQSALLHFNHVIFFGAPLSRHGTAADAPAASNDFPSPDTVAFIADVRSSVWINWKSLLTRGRPVVHLPRADSDVVVLRNPWPSIAPGMGNYDLMFQAEALEKPDCTTQVNGGQLYAVKSSAPLLKCVLQTEAIATPTKLDQDFGARPNAERNSHTLPSLLPGSIGERPSNSCHVAHLAWIPCRITQRTLHGMPLRG